MGGAAELLWVYTFSVLIMSLDNEAIKKAFKKMKSTVVARGEGQLVQRLASFVWMLVC